MKKSRLEASGYSCSATLGVKGQTDSHYPEVISGQSKRGGAPLFYILPSPQGWLRGLLFIIRQTEVLVCQLGG